MMLESSVQEREAVAHRVAVAVEKRLPVHLIYEPRDATRYELVFTPLEECLLVGHLPYLEIDRWVMSDPHNRRSMTVSMQDGHYTDPAYLIEKWADHPWTACVLAELLNMITGATQVEDMRAQYPGVFG